MYLRKCKLHTSQIAKLDCIKTKDYLINPTKHKFTRASNQLFLFLHLYCAAAQSLYLTRKLLVVVRNKRAKYDKEKLHCFKGSRSQIMPIYTRQMKQKMCRLKFNII